MKGVEIKKRIGEEMRFSSSTVCPECGKEAKDINRHIRSDHYMVVPINRIAIGFLVQTGASQFPYFVVLICTAILKIQ
jgi:hypothetical protein